MSSADELAFPPQQIPTPHGTTHVAQVLGLTRPAAEQLILCGLADTLTGETTGFRNHLDRTVITPAGLSALSAVKPVHQDHGRALNPRCRAALRVNDSDRDYLGWHAKLTSAEANLSTSRWWSIPRADTDLMPFVVTIAGFVVKCGRIQGHYVDRGKSAFDVDWDDHEVAAIWSGRRIQSTPGGAIGYL